MLRKNRNHAVHKKPTAPNLQVVSPLFDMRVANPMSHPTDLNVRGLSKKRNKLPEGSRFIFPLKTLRVHVPK